MRPSSPLSLLIFLQIATALPFPTTYLKDSPHLRGYQGAADGPTVVIPSSKLLVPYSTTNQADSLSNTAMPNAEEASNAPGSHTLVPSRSDRLASFLATYLRAITNPALRKPTHRYGKPDTRNWSPEAISSLDRMREEVKALKGPMYPKPDSIAPVEGRPSQISDCSGALTEGVYVRIEQSTPNVRNDLMVVGIVALFFVIMLIFEIYDKYTSKRARYSESSQPEPIYFDDEKVALEEPSSPQEPYCPQSPIDNQ